MQPINILLVEDSLADTVLIKESMEESKISLHLDCVVDGEAATDYLYQKLKNNEPLPDLMILDLNLPKKDGREVLVEVKTHPELKTIPIVVLSTSSNRDDIDHAYKHYANSFITKPVDLEQFMRIVNSINDFWLTIVKLPNK